MAEKKESKEEVQEPEDNQEVQERVDQETEQGYRGVTPDPTPNENYTVAGVTAGKPTPETDADLRAKARANIEVGR